LPGLVFITGQILQFYNYEKKEVKDKQTIITKSLLKFENQ
jgi:hypothetical protein